MPNIPHKWSPVTPAAYINLKAIQVTVEDNRAISLTFTEKFSKLQISRYQYFHDI